MDRKNINRGFKKRWKYQVTTRMKKAHRQGQGRFAKSKDFLKQYPFFAAMLNKLWSLTWYAYIGASLVDPRFSIQKSRQRCYYCRCFITTRIGIMFNPFKRIRCRCTFCNKTYRIPRLRILRFEMFVDIKKGSASGGSGNVMIATKGWLSRVLIRTFMAKQ